MAPPPSALRPPICGVQRVRQIYLDVFSDVMLDAAEAGGSVGHLHSSGRKWLTLAGSVMLKAAKSGRRLRLSSQQSRVLSCVSV